MNVALAIEFGVESDTAETTWRVLVNGRSKFVAGMTFLWRVSRDSSRFLARSLSSVTVEGILISMFVTSSMKCYITAGRLAANGRPLYLLTDLLIQLPPHIPNSYAHAHKRAESNVIRQGDQINVLSYNPIDKVGARSMLWVELLGLRFWQARRTSRNASRNSRMSLLGVIRCPLG